MKTLDFRSDTVTRPGPEMRAAMAAAEVGDDVLDHDPGVDRLERRVADLLDQEAGLWLPSGSMANLVALMLHLQRGDRFLAPARAQVLGTELSAGAGLAGGMGEALAWDAGPGRITPMQVHRAAPAPAAHYGVRTALLCLENSHALAGGACTPAAEHQALVEQARSKGLKVHLDGARLWHAAAALGEPPAALARGVDTVAVCLGKGLGAPMGSVLCGGRELAAEARRVRRVLGGAVRQAGVMAAAGLVALDYLPRLPEDHAKARRLAEGLRRMGFTAPEPQTNILFVPMPDAAAAASILEEARVKALPVGSCLRFVTHRDLLDADVVEALERIRPMADRLVTTWEGDRPMV